MDTVRSRLAPTPSGWLHVGNGAAFVLTWLLTRAVNGNLLLRIDDLDRQRRRPEYVDDIFRTIDWLGLDYDRGPTGTEDFLRNWSQSLRQLSYSAALDALWAAGRLYACDCSRRTLRERHADGVYRGFCRSRGLARNAERVAWRFRLPDQATVKITEATGAITPVDLTTTMGDFVVRRKNGSPAYQVASVVDDTEFGINFVVRGADLIDSTAAQLLLAAYLPHCRFGETTFYHHPLVRGDDAAKLSKSAGAQALNQWREEGRSPAAVFEIAKSWLGAPETVGAQAAELLYWLREQPD
jgi:glutamyl/glutaminyl-tRNA synthetase